MDEMEITTYRTITFYGLAKAYEDKYDEELDVEDLFFDYCNGAYKKFNITEVLEEIWDVDEDGEEYEEEPNDSAIKKVISILREYGIKDDETILILLNW